MIYKLIGAALVIIGCGGFGFSLVATHIKEERTLRQLLSVLDYMECELQYHLTPLPALCNKAGGEAKGILGQVFMMLSRELEAQISPDVAHCMDAVLSKVPELTKSAVEILRFLGGSLGRFDLEGQLKGFETVRQECRQKLLALNNNRDYRLRSYKTLGLCAGAALAILFI